MANELRQIGGNTLMGRVYSFADESMTSLR